MGNYKPPLPRTHIKRPPQPTTIQPHPQPQSPFGTAAPNHTTTAPTSTTPKPPTPPSKHTSLKFKLNQRRSAPQVTTTTPSPASTSLSSTAPPSTPTSTPTIQQTQQLSLSSITPKNGIKLNLTPKPSATTASQVNTTGRKATHGLPSTSSSPSSASPARAEVKPSLKLKLKLNNPKNRPSPIAAAAPRAPAPAARPSFFGKPTPAPTPTPAAAPATNPLAALNAFLRAPAPAPAPAHGDTSTTNTAPNPLFDASLISPSAFPSTSTAADAPPPTPWSPTPQYLSAQRLALRRLDKEILAEKRAELSLARLQLSWCVVGGVPEEDLLRLQGRVRVYSEEVGVIEKRLRDGKAWETEWEEESRVEEEREMANRGESGRKVKGKAGMRRALMSKQKRNGKSYARA